MQYLALKDVTVDGKTITAGTVFNSDKVYNNKKLACISDSKENKDEQVIKGNDNTSIDKLETYNSTEPIKEKVNIIFTEVIEGEAEDAIEFIKNSTNHPYKITIIDNTKEKSTKLSTMWNNAIKESDCRYNCLINNDAYVTDGWLTEIMKGFQINKTAIVGPTGDKVGGLQKTLKNNYKPYKNKFKELLYFSGFCFVVDKKAMEEDIGYFPEEVEFYGGESMWGVKVFRAGYKILWAQGAFCRHVNKQTVNATNRYEELKEKGYKQVSKWCARTSPVLFLTYNRLEYTKKSYKALINSDIENIIIIDNNSTDGTREWLKKRKSKKINEIVFNDKNKGVAGAMNQFFDMTKGERYVGKVDNDTIVPKNWFRKQIELCERNNVKVMQPKHSIQHGKYNSFDEWMHNCEQLSHGIWRESYVGGSAIVIRRDNIRDRIENQGNNSLSGWTSFQMNHSELKPAFTDKVEIDLLDMTDDNQNDFSKYPNYYKKVGRDNNSNWDGKYEHKTTFETIEVIFDNLGEKFAYTRFGDGELLMMEDFDGREITQYNSPEFKRELKEAFTINNDKYLIACSAGMENEKGMKKGLFARFDNDDELQDIVKKYYYYKKDFYNPIALDYLLVFYQNILKQLFNKLSEYKLAFVGGKHLFEIDNYLPIKEYIEIPSKQAYDTIDKWYSKIKKISKKVDIILISAGPTAQIIQKRLWREENVATIDIGSLSEALTGENVTHTWIKMAEDEINKFNELFKSN